MQLLSTRMENWPCKSKVYLYFFQVISLSSALYGLSHYLLKCLPFQAPWPFCAPWVYSFLSHQHLLQALDTGYTALFSQHSSAIYCLPKVCLHFSSIFVSCHVCFVFSYLRKLIYSMCLSCHISWSNTFPLCIPLHPPSSPDTHPP